jgi:hypothetical protein
MYSIAHPERLMVVCMCRRCACASPQQAVEPRSMKIIPKAEKLKATCCSLKTVLRENGNVEGKVVPPRELSKHADEDFMVEAGENQQMDTLV